MKNLKQSLLTAIAAIAISSGAIAATWVSTDYVGVWVSEEQAELNAIAKLKAQYPNATSTFANCEYPAGAHMQVWECVAYGLLP